MTKLVVEPLSSRDPSPLDPPAHWVGNPPTHFQNPWPSFVKNSLYSTLQTRFGSERNFVPVPESRDELVKVRSPDWGRDLAGFENGIKATWLGHAGFLVETSCSGADPEKDTAAPANLDSKTGRRGIRILFDTVFSERTSPVTWAGPKRYTPAPCTLEELPNVDLVAISHDHYDHLDFETIKAVYERSKKLGTPIHFLAGLGAKHWYLNAGLGITSDEVTECDWWDSLHVTLEGVGEITITCTPTQHFSGRSLLDHGKTLWCSWVVEDLAANKKLYFAGDTAYQATGTPSPCPVFKQIGEVFGGFDLALVPIGLFMPESFMGSVHTSPEQSVKIHEEIRSRKTIGMHWGTFRGGLSGQYEDVRDPPRRWREAAEKAGKWGTECGLCDVGETVIV